MGFTVIANNTAAVNGKDHWQTLKADIMHNLVKGTLQKGGIYRHHWYKTLGS
jgi:hypothetical protein